MYSFYVITCNSSECIEITDLIELIRDLLAENASMCTTLRMWACHKQSVKVKGELLGQVLNRKWFLHVYYIWFAFFRQHTRWLLHQAQCSSTEASIRTALFCIFNVILRIIFDLQSTVKLWHLNVVIKQVFSSDDRFAYVLLSGLKVMNHFSLNML